LLLLNDELFLLKGTNQHEDAATFQHRRGKNRFLADERVKERVGKDALSHLLCLLGVGFGLKCGGRGHEGKGGGKSGEQSP
jgi:hypothetical protein